MSGGPPGRMLENNRISSWHNLVIGRKSWDNQNIIV